MPKPGVLTIEDKKFLASLMTKIVKESSSGKLSGDESMIAYGNLLAMIKIVQKGLLDIAGTNKELRKVINDNFKSADLEKKFIQLGGTSKKITKGIKTSFEDAAKAILGDSSALNDMSESFDDLIKSTENYTHNLSDTSEIYDEINNLQTSMKDNFIKYAGSVEDGTSLLQQHIKKVSDIDDLTKSVLFDQEKYNDYIRELSTIQIEPNISKVQIDGKMIDSSKIMPEIKKISNQWNKMIDAETNRLDDMYANIAKDVVRNSKNISVDETTQKVTKTLTTKNGGTESFATNLSLEKVYENIASLLKTIGDTSDSNLAASKEALNTLQTTYGIQDDISTMMAQEVSSAQKKLVANKAQLAFEQHKVEIAKQFGKTLKFNDKIIEGASDHLGELVSILPKGIVEFTGLDRLSSSLSANLNKANEKFVEMVAKGEGGTKNIKAWKGYTSTLLGDFGKILTPTTLILAGLAAIVKVTHEYQEALIDISKTQGVSINHAAKMYEFNAELVASSKDMITTRAKALDIENELLNTTGEIFDITQAGAADLIRQVDGISEAFGIASGDVAKMTQAFQMMGADNKLSTDLDGYVASLSEAAGLSPKIVTQDLINNADTLAMYFGGLPKEAAQAVVSIKRLGIQIGKVGDLVQKTWNIEGFLTDMYELKAMSGIDLSKTFEAGIAGDFQKTIEATLDAIGSIDNLNRQSPQVLKKIADTTGITTEELRKSLVLREKGLSLTGDEAKLLSKMPYDDIVKMSKEEIKHAAHNLSLTEETNKEWDKVKSQMMTAILPAMKGVTKLAAGIVPIIGVIGDLLGGMLKPIGWIAELIDTIIHKFQDLYHSIFPVSEATDHLAESGENVKSSIMGSIFSVNGLGTAIGSVYVASKTVVPLWKKISSVMGSSNAPIDAMGTGIDVLTKKSGMLGSLWEKISSPIKSIMGKTGEKVGDLVSNVIGNKATDSVEKMTINRKKTPNSDRERPGTFWNSKDSKKAVGEVEKIQGPVEKILGDISAAIGTTFVDLMTGLGSGIGALIQGILTGIAKGVGAFSAAAAGLGEFALVMGIVDVSAIALGYAFKLAEKGLHEFAGVIDSIGNAMSKIWSTVGDAVIGIIKEMGTQLVAISKINALNMFAVAGGISAISASLIAFSVATTASSIGNFVSNIFGGNVLDKLASVGKIADPLHIAAVAINSLDESLKSLSNTLEQINLESISKLNNINVDQLQQKQQSAKIITSRPEKEATAQNVTITPGNEVIYDGIGKVNSNRTDNNINTGNKTPGVQDYLSNKQISTTKIENLLQQVIQGLAAIADRPSQVVFGNAEIKRFNSILRGSNNNN